MTDRGKHADDFDHQNAENTKNENDVCDNITPDLPEDLSEEEIQIMMKKMIEAHATMEKEFTEQEDQMLRLQADFVNFRRRTQKEKQEWQNQAAADIIFAILPAMDNFDRALEAMKTSPEGKNYAAGVDMIQKQIIDCLKNEGLEEISAVGKEFDPEWHEAVEQVDSKEKSGTIIEENQPGYSYKGKLLRPSKVIVAK